jgi:adenosylmethionine-8-amino-7-oxononanoate aminotransferase
MQGAAGMWAQPVEYSQRSARFAGATVCFYPDEVATGFGRTGKCSRASMPA